jgi:hypothetical protein
VRRFEIRQKPLPSKLFGRRRADRCDDRTFEAAPDRRLEHIQLALLPRTGDGRSGTAALATHHSKTAAVTPTHGNNTWDARVTIMFLLVRLSETARRGLIKYLP